MGALHLSLFRSSPPFLPSHFSVGSLRRANTTAPLFLRYSSHIGPCENRAGLKKEKPLINLSATKELFQLMDQQGVFLGLPDDVRLRQRPSGSADAAGGGDSTCHDLGWDQIGNAQSLNIPPCSISLFPGNCDFGKQTASSPGKKKEEKRNMPPVGGPKSAWSYGPQHPQLKNSKAR